LPSIHFFVEVREREYPFEHKQTVEKKENFYHHQTIIITTNMSTSNITTSKMNSASVGSMTLDDTVRFVEFIVTTLKHYEELKKKKKDEIWNLIKDLTGKQLSKKTRNEILFKEFFDYCVLYYYKDLENKPVRELKNMARDQKNEMKTRLFPSLISEFSKKFSVYRVEKKISGENKENLIEKIRSFARYCIDFAIEKDIKFDKIPQGNIEPKLENDKISKRIKKRKISESSPIQPEPSLKRMTVANFPTPESKSAEYDDEKEQLKQIDIDKGFLGATKEREVLKAWQDNYTKIKNELLKHSNNQEQTISNLLTCTPEAVKNYSEKQCASLKNMIDMLNTLNEKAAITMSKFK
jgi:hypothetical protein